MPLIALLFFLLALVLFVVAGWLLRDTFLRLTAFGLASLTVGIALISLMPHADKVHF